jgi:hypothetical protein
MLVVYTRLMERNHSRATRKSGGNECLQERQLLFQRIKCQLTFPSSHAHIPALKTAKQQRETFIYVKQRITG